MNGGLDLTECGIIIRYVQRRDELSIIWDINNQIKPAIDWLFDTLDQIGDYSDEQDVFQKNIWDESSWIELSDNYSDDFPRSFIKIIWTEPDPFNLIPQFMGRVLFLIEKYFDEIYTPKLADWKNIFTIETIGEINPVYVRDPSDLILFSPRIEIRCRKSQDELRLLGIRTFVEKGFSNVIYKGLDPFLHKQDVFWKLHFGKGSLLRSPEYIIEWIWSKDIDFGADWLDFLTRVKTTCEKGFHNLFIQEKLNWKEFVEITVFTPDKIVD